jgi:hypothetical protein
MPTVRENAARIKRFRELKATLRTDRARLLVGIDVAQAEHVVHVRHAHTRVVVATLTIPNTTRGFTALWARIAPAQRSTGCREVVCGLELTGTYHQAVAAFLETQGADVVLLSSSVAYQAAEKLVPKRPEPLPEHLKRVPDARSTAVAASSALPSAQWRGAARRARSPLMRPPPRDSAFG